MKRSSLEEQNEKDCMRTSLISRVTKFAEARYNAYESSMATMSLFGQNSDGRREPKSLVEFRAGKMKLEGKTVTADTRKGLVYLKMMEDTLLHFYWKDRQTGKVEDVSVSGAQ